MLYPTTTIELDELKVDEHYIIDQVIINSCDWRIPIPLTHPIEIIKEGSGYYTLNCKGARFEGIHYLASARALATLLIIPLLNNRIPEIIKDNVHKARYPNPRRLDTGKLTGTPTQKAKP